MACCKNAIVVLFFVCFAASANSQDTIVLHQKSRWDSSFDTNLHIAFYVDPTNKKDIRAVIKQPFEADTNFRHSMQFLYGNRFITAWMRWTIRNPSAVSEEVL